MILSNHSIHHTLKSIFVGILLFSFRQVFAADVPSSAVSDDSAFRLSIRDTWLAETPQKVLAQRPFTGRLPGGGAVQVRAEERNGDVTVIVARERNGAFPGWAQGSWLYTRNLASGNPVRIRIFLRSDANMYVQLRPMGVDKSQLDVVIYEAYVIRGLAMGIPFERLLTLPVEEVLTAAGDRFPRRYFDPDPRLYRAVYSPESGVGLVSRIRSALPGLNYEDDGTMDENGRYVFINTLTPQPNPEGLNCSGFAKWVVDGMLRPITGKRLAVTPLKAPASPRTSSLQAAHENQDALFGLDWTRNLALEAARVLRSPSWAELENVEVRQGAFGALIDRSRGFSVVKIYPGFIPNAGFNVEGLRPLLYTLTVNEPGNLYLASVNQERGAQRQHYHVAVLVPYFNEYGVFQIAVFESAAETNVQGFIRRHPGAMVNLVRIPVEGVFAP